MVYQVTLLPPPGTPSLLTIFMTPFLTDLPDELCKVVTVILLRLLEVPAHHGHLLLSKLDRQLRGNQFFQQQKLYL